MNKYIELRNKFIPEDIKIIFVFESPPENKGYFYDSNAKTGELLFRSLMEVLFNEKPKTKIEGLKKFQNSGYLLVNPIYEPVNKLSDKIADELILKNYPEFLKDLKNLTKNKDVGIILVKSNICRLLENRLIGDKFNVLNNAKIIPFPIHYHFQQFKKLVSDLCNLT
ncbi:MAG: hypothetical protein M1324_00170 [Patescibacteria group bacterium]|nr:hypothetical protein [Patescibacteria group bacterium]